jgi:nitrogen fixation NifU-like protein
VSDLQQLYRDAIRAHAANPVGFGRAIAATHRHELYNAQCGDRVEVRLRVTDGIVEEAAFDGEGCAICLASASLLCENAPGNPPDALRLLHDTLADLLHGRLEADAASPLGPLAGVRPYPARRRCAMLPWQAVLKAIETGPATD